MVVLVLVVLWVAVLAPRAIRRVREGHSQTSIESFHEQLHFLERAGPKLVEPAYRLGAPVVPLRSRTSSEDHLGADGAEPGYRGLALLERPTIEREDLRSLSGPRVGPAARRRGRRRRRDILLGLVVTALLTGVVGAMHGLQVLWTLTAVSVIAIAGYVALAAYVQMLDAERQAMKPITSGRPERLPSPWALNRPRHAPDEGLPGVEVLTAPTPWAAKAGYPGAWDEDGTMARHAAAGG